jgi:uracil-DNA glycosylase
MVGKPFCVATSQGSCLSASHDSSVEIGRQIAVWAREFVVPERKDPGTKRVALSVVRKQAQVCRRCDLWRHATQTVFGEGPTGARIMLVGEQPGDVEDREGHPFVGPAGQLLRGALEDAGIDPSDVYVTNVVKHFKWEPRGKRRIHKKPRASEVDACRLWLDAEIAHVKPQAIVALGATAARAVIGPDAKVTRDRTKPFPSPLAPLVTLTVHPSSILRAPDSETRAAERAHFVDDLRTIAARVR